MRGYLQGRFSFNVKGGRCEACSGDGTIKIEMNFLPDVYVPCEVCHGARYNRETLEVHYKGKTIAEVLDMPIEEAAEFFAAVPAISRHMRTLCEVGLGYVRLGQPATTLSGGEAQRVKLSSELQKRSTGRTVYVLDEPTTGLHFEDIRKLLLVLGRLVDQGDTVLVIEHNLDVIKTADWIIDMGPEGGSRGGMVVAEGSPEEVAAHPGRLHRPVPQADARRSRGQRPKARKRVAAARAPAGERRRAPQGGRGKRPPPGQGQGQAPQGSRRSVPDRRPSRAPRASTNGRWVGPGPSRTVERDPARRRRDNLHDRGLNRRQALSSATTIGIGLPVLAACSGGDARPPTRATPGQCAGLDRRHRGRQRHDLPRPAGEWSPSPPRASSSASPPCAPTRAASSARWPTARSCASATAAPTPSRTARC